MRTFNGFCLAVLLSSGLFAQYRNPAPVTTGGFGNVVFPGGTSAMPGVTRNFGNVVFPGTGGPKVQVPFSITDPTFGDRLGRTIAGQNVYGQQFGRGGRNNNRTVTLPYAVPVYVGGGYYDNSAAAAQPASQPNVIVVYPQQQAPQIVNQAAPPDLSSQYLTVPAPEPQSNVNVYQAPVSPRPDTPATTEPARFLIAFKDHTIYSAVAYWVEADTLHYFTNGNTHNQVSLSLIDKELTERLNRETGSEVKLPK